MQLKYRLPLLILATAALTICRLHAEEDDEDEEEFGSFGFLAGSPQSTSISLKMTQGPKVQFGNLGNIAVTSAQGVNRNYMDGTVNKDARRAFGFGNSGSGAELDVNNRELYPAGGRYQTTFVDSSGATVTADYLAYANGLTRGWSYANESQTLTKPGYIAFNIYSARTQGESLLGSKGYTGGIEVSVAQKLTDPAKKISFSLVAGLTLNGINSSKSGQVNSTLHTYTDYFSLHGADAPISTIASEIVEGVRYTGPSGINTILTDANGVSTIKETTTTISDTPEISGEESDEVDGATVSGLWKLRGAYFTLKLGPQVSAKFTRSLGLSASVGFAGTYVGTTYTSSESFSVDGVSRPINFDPESSSVKKLLPGYYANIDATWTVNDRTDFFAGFSYDNLGEYTQKVGGRTAKVDLSSTAGVRGGLSIKF